MLVIVIEAYCIVVASSSIPSSRFDEHMIGRLTSRMIDAYFEALQPDGRKRASVLHTFMHKIEVLLLIADAKIVRQTPSKK